MVWVLSLSDMDLGTHALTAAAVSSIRSSSGVGDVDPLALLVALPP